MKRFNLILISSIIIFSIFACKNYEEDIIGAWNYQTYDNQPQGTIIYNFKENNLLIRVINADNNIYIDSCQYLIEKSLFKKQMTISGAKVQLVSGDVNGLYRIEKFSDNVVVMTRIKLANDQTNGAYLRCELNRRQ